MYLIKSAACFLMLCVFYGPLPAQCGAYLDNRHLADSCFQIHAYAQAADYYQKCIVFKERKRVDFYYAAAALIRNQQPALAWMYLKIAADDGLHYRKKEEFEKDTLFQKLYSEDAKWKAVGEKIKNNTIQFQNRIHLDPSLIGQLQKRRSLDQQYRHPEILLLPKTTRDSLSQIQMKNDHENQQWLAEAIRLHGWPVISTVSEEGDETAWLIAQHADNDTAFQKICLELLKKAASENETNVHHVAYLEDRIRVNTNHPQLYGTQFESVVENGKTVDLKLKPTEDLPCLDKRRAYMELEPVENYLRFAKKRYHVGQ